MLVLVNSISKGYKFVSVGKLYKDKSRKAYAAFYTQISCLNVGVQLEMGRDAVNWLTDGNRTSTNAHLGTW